jgi:hypothetical protein
MARCLFAGYSEEYGGNSFEHNSWWTFALTGRKKGEMPGTTKTIE